MCKCHNLFPLSSSTCAKAKNQPPARIHAHIGCGFPANGYRLSIHPDALPPVVVRPALCFLCIFPSPCKYRRRLTLAGSCVSTPLRLCGLFALEARLCYTEYWFNKSEVVEVYHMTGHAELQCKTYPYGTLNQLRFVVICTFLGEKYVLSYHRKHASWETQGGHIEADETPEEAAHRELYEESGIVAEKLIPVCDYYAYDSEGSSNGRVYAVKIQELGTLPESEMSTVKAFDDLPENLTYPFVTPVLFLEAKQAIDN